MDDPVLSRGFLGRQVEATPELFPPEVHKGYRMKDIYTSRKTGWVLRRTAVSDQSHFNYPRP